VLTYFAQRWPATAHELGTAQEALAAQAPPPWTPPPGPLRAAGCFICFEARGLDERAWAGAALLAGHRLVAARVVSGVVSHPYEPGLLALREGPLLAASVDRLPERPEVLIVNATGRDHPRGAGLAVHLGAVLDIPTVGVTDRPLVARGHPPQGDRGTSSPLVLGGEVVARWVVTRPGARPIVIHGGWRTDLGEAVQVVLRCVRRARTPEPIRRARRVARLARAGQCGAART
jgi:deoxyribonuclease V